MVKKFILGVVLIAAVSALGYYAYHNVLNNRYELTYEIQKNKDWDPYTRTHKFIARNDSIASEEAVEWLIYQFIFDNPELEKSKYRYQYKHLKLRNATKDTLVRVPVSLIRKTFIEGSSSEYAQFNERDVDWLMFADTIPYFNYDMSIWLENPYQEKRLSFIADNDYQASKIAIDTVAYYIGNYWYYSNRPVEDILLVNTFTLDFVHSDSWIVNYRLTNSPYCKDINFRRYPVRYRGLLDD